MTFFTHSKKLIYLLVNYNCQNGSSRNKAMTKTQWHIDHCIGFMVCFDLFSVRGRGGGECTKNAFDYSSLVSDNFQKLHVYFHPLFKYIEFIFLGKTNFHFSS